MLRGWDESGMGKAMALAHDGVEFNTNSAEFLEACRLQETGKLFERYTDKSNTKTAEQFMSARFDDLFGDEDEVEMNGRRPDDTTETALELQCQEGLFATLRAQGQAHQQAELQAQLQQ